MDTTDDSGQDTLIPTEVLVAIEDTKLRLVVENVLKAVDREYQVLSPGRLLHREYPGGYLIYMETGNDLRRLKDIASQICMKWGRKSSLQPCLENFFMVYFIRSEVLKDDIASLWAIAGWDVSSMRDPDPRDYQEISRVTQLFATRVRSHRAPQPAE